MYCNICLYEYKAINVEVVVVTASFRRFIERHIFSSKGRNFREKANQLKQLYQWVAESSTHLLLVK